MGKIKWFFIVLALMLALLPGSLGRGLVRGSAMSPTPPPPPKEEIAAKNRLMRFDNLPPLMQPDPGAPQTQPRLPNAMPGIYSWSKIAFQRFYDNNYEVFVAMGDGSDPQRLTFDPANDGRARLNRGATQVVFSSNRDGDFEIYSINVDGSNLRQLTFNSYIDARPAWSPDGKKITFWSDETGHAEIYTMNADGSGRTQLTSSGGLDCFDPIWSPDGTRIAYVTWDADGYGYLWTVPATGGTPSAVSTNRLFYAGDPAWSPDGSMIAFDQADEYSYFYKSLFITHLSNGYTEVRDILNQETYEDHYVGGWAPDGQELLFNRIQYMVVNNKLYISNAFMETRCFDTGAGCKRDEIRLQGDGTDFLPDWQSADLVPPTSTIQPLPAYSQADGFNLQWLTQISGLAGLQGYNLQVRQNQGPWQVHYLYKNPSQSEFITGFSPGQVLGFRLQAYDEAGNLEPWTQDPKGDAHTTLYAYSLKGRSADLRDRPVPAAALTIDPQALNSQPVAPGGNYRAYLQTRNAYTVTAQAAGYGKIAATTRNPLSDAKQDLYFPPLNDLIEDGGFEDQAMQAWQISAPLSSTDQLTATRQTDYRATGSAALTLGSACQEPCFTPPETFNTSAVLASGSSNATALQENHGAIAVQADGTVQIVSWEPDGLKAFQRSPMGAWSPPVILDPGSGGDMQPPYLKITPSGTTIAIWYSPDNDVYRMAVKPPYANWGNPTDLQVGNVQDVVIDSKGGLYLLYLQGERMTGYYLLYAYRTPSGVWQAPVIAFEPNDIGLINVQGAMTITSDQVLHVFWTYQGTWGTYLLYRRLTPKGQVLEDLALSTSGSQFYDSMVAMADDLGQVHLIYNGGHFMRHTDGTWSAHTALPAEFGFKNSAAVFGNSLHLMGTYAYLRYDPGSGWSVSPWKPDTERYVLGLDAKGLLHIADDASYRTQVRAAQDGSVAISQKLTVPDTLHQPTLAFDAQLRAPQGLKHSYYEASITQGVTTTQVFSSNLAAPWTHHWLDLEAWAGKEITLTFSLYQGAGDPLAYLDLDDVSLGAWDTPVIDSATPAALLEPAGQVITITGQNFIQKPQVRIGSTALPAANVSWSDENTLLVTLPAGLSLGDQDVRVTNPGGQVAILPDGLRLGYIAFVPLLQR